MRRWTRPLVLSLPLPAVLGALAALPAASPAETAPVGTAAAKGKLEMLFVQNARSGSLTPLSGGRYRLTLRGVDPHVVYFSDRPQRVTGTTDTEHLVADLFGRGAPPNAALEIPGGDADHDAMAVELQSPRYDKAKRTLTYTVRGLRDSGSLTHPRLAAMRDRLDRELPRRFGAVSLFIDDSDWGNTCTANLVSNAQNYVTESSANDWPTDHWDDNPAGLAIKPNETKGWKSGGGFGRGCSNTVTFNTWDGSTIVITTESPVGSSNTYTCDVTNNPNGYSPYTCNIGPGSQLNGPVLLVNWIVYQSPTQSGS
jgi:hypothetical protein